MNKRMLSLGFAVALFFSTAIILAQGQAAAPVHKEGDTWQFNISRKGQIASSTDQNDGMYELSVTQGAVKLYDVNGGQKTEMPIQSEGPSQGLLRLVEKATNDRILNFRCRQVKNGPMSTKLDRRDKLGIKGGLSRLLLPGWNR
jgi:hypothetical protein